MNAEERARRVWHVLHRRRREQGWEPVRRHVDLRLIGWVRPIEGRNAIELRHGTRVVLCTRAEMAFRKIEDDPHPNESCWIVPSHISELLSVDIPYPEELNYDPVNPDPISTMPGEPNYSPTYPKSTG